MLRLLITGATGFIGVAAVRAATDAFEVHATARTPRPTGAIFHSCDLLDSEEPVRLIEAIRPTHLLHLAWIATPGAYWSSPANHRWVAASKRLLRAFARCGGMRAVVAGSCAEYDWTAGGRCREFDTPLCPRTVYGRCKLELSNWGDDLGPGAGGKGRVGEAVLDVRPARTPCAARAIGGARAPRGGAGGVFRWNSGARLPPRR